MAEKFCQYAKSGMTPCVRRDGDTAFAIGLGDRPICVGCERGPTMCGVRYPANWTQVVADYKKGKGNG